MYKPHEKDIFGILAEGFKTLASLKKVGSKPKRRECVYKRAAKAQSDLFRKRRRSEMSALVTFVKKSPQAIYRLRRRV